jgi:hypothetical protein
MTESGAGQHDLFWSPPDVRTSHAYIRVIISVRTQPPSPPSLSSLHPFFPHTHALPTPSSSLMLHPLPPTPLSQRLQRKQVADVEARIRCAHEPSLIQPPRRAMPSLIEFSLVRSSPDPSPVGPRVAVLVRARTRCAFALPSQPRLPVPHLPSYPLWEAFPDGENRSWPRLESSGSVRSSRKRSSLTRSSPIRCPPIQRSCSRRRCSHHRCCHRRYRRHCSLALLFLLQSFLPWLRLSRH